MLAYKNALDGHAAGRFNSSGVAGGIFAGNEFAGEGVAAAMTAGQGRQMMTGTTPPRDVGPILGGGGEQPRLGIGGAAGGRSSNARPDGVGHTRGNLRGVYTNGGEQPMAGGRPSNARPDGVGHTRGNLRGADNKPLLEDAAGSRTVEGAFAKFLQRGPAALTQPYALQHEAQAGAEVRHAAADDFLERVSMAEQRDAEDKLLLDQLHELEAQSGLIEAAAAQIAREEGLDSTQQAALAYKMLAHVSQQASRLRTLMAQREAASSSPRQSSHRQASNRQASNRFASIRQASNRRHANRPPDATLTGILSQEEVSPAHSSSDFGPRNPIRGHGACNPNVEYGSPEYRPNSRDVTGGIQIMPNMGGKHGSSKFADAAGEPSTNGWRSTHNYMANGAEGYGDFRSEHLALRASERTNAGGHRHLQTESKVVLGGNPGGLYPRAPSMIRGKFPGY